MSYFIRRAIKKLVVTVYRHATLWMDVQATERRRKAARERIGSFAPPYQLHFGCGNVRLEGWVNIDFNVSSRSCDVIWDVTKQFPLQDSCCRYIYHEHLLEHLSPEQGLAFLKECHRLLQPCGVVRVAMPSLEYTVEKYQSANWRDQEWLKWPGYQFIQTRAEMLNIGMRWWGHKWLYDSEELERRLREAGFQNISQRSPHESAFTELQRLETRADSRLICEAIKSGLESDIPVRLAKNAARSIDTLDRGKQ